MTAPRPSDPAVLATQLQDLRDKTYSPYAHDDLTFLGKPDWTWKPTAPARAQAIAISGFAQQQAVLDTDIAPLNAHPPRHAVMYNQSIVHIADARVSDGLELSDRTAVMHRKRPRIWALNRRVMPDYLASAPTSKDRDLPLHATATSLADLGARDVFRIPAPGIGNYFHGVWEVLPQLMPAATAGFKGTIALPIKDEALPGFIQSHAELVFPELIDQIKIDRVRPDMPPRGAGVYRNFYAGFDWSFYAQMAADSPVDIGLPGGDFDVFNLTTPFAFFFNNTNSYTVHQKAFRDRAVAAVAGMDFSHLPRRFWISRKGSYRRPEMMGEADLLAELKPLGFEEVRVETLSAAEQVGLFQNAEVVAGQHGAGMTNLMFASPKTTIVEIGHGRTIERWRTFHQMTAAAGCKHIGVFCDYDIDDPTRTPNMRLEGFPTPAMSPAAVTQIAALIAGLL